MAETIVEIMELQKRWFADRPKGDINIAYVFYQSKDNSRYVMETEKKKVMSAELRIGKYDRVMKINRGRFSTIIQKKIACEEEGHSFCLTLNVSYYIKDPEYIYKNKVYEIETELEHSLSGLEFELGGTCGFREMPKIESSLWEYVNKCFAELGYLTITYTMPITLDETARQIVERERQHEIIENDADLSAMEEKGQMENRFEIEQQKLENEKEIVRLQADIQRFKVDDLGEMFKRYGTNAGNLIAFANGELSGEKMSQILNQNQKEQRKDIYNMLRQLYEDGIMTDAMAEQLMPQILSVIKGIDSKGQEQIEEQTKTGKQEDESKDGTERAEIGEGTFMWNYDAGNEDGTVE